MEHTLEFLRKLVPALHLKLRQHAPLRVVRHGSPKEKPLGEMTFVVPLEDVLICEEAEDRDRLVENAVHFSIRFLDCK